jgi:hypothetical protein
MASGVGTYFFKNPQFLGILSGSKLPGGNPSGTDGNSSTVSCTSSVHGTSSVHEHTNATANLNNVCNTNWRGISNSSSSSSSSHEELSGAVGAALNGWRVPKISPLFRNPVCCEDKKAWPDNERYAVRDSKDLTLETWRQTMRDTRLGIVRTIPYIYSQNR